MERHQGRFFVSESIFMSLTIRLLFCLLKPNRYIIGGGNNVKC